MNFRSMLFCVLQGQTAYIPPVLLWNNQVLRDRVFSLSRLLQLYQVLAMPVSEENNSELINTEETGKRCLWTKVFSSGTEERVNALLLKGFESEIQVT